MSNPSVPLPKPVYFECSMCGECCSSISIPLEAHKAEHLLKQQWFTERLKSYKRTLEPITPAFYRMPLTDEGTCVFLAEDKRCLIEAHEGKDAKPEECRNFPFASARTAHTPDQQVLYDVSASCKHVAETLILAFAPVLPNPSMTLTLSYPLLPDPLPVLGRKTYTWEQFLAHQQQLRQLFSRSELSPQQALKAAQILMTSGKMPAMPAPGFQFAAGWSYLIPIVFLRKPYGSFSWFSLLSGGDYQDRYIFGPVSLRLKTPGARQWPEAQQRHLKAFLHNILQRYVLFTHEYPKGHSLASLLSIACVGYFLVRWYAEALAWLRDPRGPNNESVSETDVAMAIRLVERYYTGHQPRFLAWFREHPLGPWLQKLLLG